MKALTLVRRTVPVRRMVPVRKDRGVKPWIIRIIPDSIVLRTLPRTLLCVGVRNSGRAQ
jgi:hypothetical protein